MITYEAKLNAEKFKHAQESLKQLKLAINNMFDGKDEHGELPIHIKSYHRGLTSGISHYLEHLKEDING